MKKLAYGGVLVLAACALGVGVARSQSAVITSLAELSSACESSDKTAGFASVVLDHDLHVRDERATLAVPCIVYLREGASLAIVDSELRSAHLVVTDDAGSMPLSEMTLPTPGTLATEKPVPVVEPLEGVARVRIERSTLTGDDDAGLLVRLLHAEGHIAVADSTLDYPASSWMTTTNTDRTGRPGGFEATGSTFRSVGPPSEGIWLVASGPGRLIDDRFETTANDGLAMVVTAPCQHSNVTGITGRCHSP